MAEVEMWRPKEGWENPYKFVQMRYQDQQEALAYEAGADAMHLADVKYLEEYEVLLNFAEEGKVRVTLKFIMEEWLAFMGKEVI